MCDTDFGIVESGWLFYNPLLLDAIPLCPTHLVGQARDKREIIWLRRGYVSRKHFEALNPVYFRLAMRAVSAGLGTKDDPGAGRVSATAFGMFFTTGER